MKYISQKGEDGFGHQVLGMMSIISLCSGELEYVPYLHDGKFEHVSSDEKLELSTELNIPTFSRNNLPKELSSIKPVKPGSRNL